MWNGASGGDGWLWVLALLLAVLGAALFAVAVEPRGRKGLGGEGHATWILRERLARGEIDEIEYRDRLAVLGAAPGRDSRRRASQTLPILAAVGAAALFIAALGTAAIASRPSGARIVSGARVAQGTACTFPTLRGQTVDVVLAECNDEWTIARRYMAAESLAKARLDVIEGEAEEVKELVAAS